MNPGILFRLFNGLRGRAFRRAMPAVAAVAVAALIFAFQQTDSSPASAQSDFPTQISGRIVNGTEGGVIPAGLQVLLLVVDEAEQTVVGNDQQVVGTNGEFTFTDFLSGPGLTYRVVANNGDHTPSVDLRPGESSFENVEITIWDSTSSFEDIHFSNYSLLVPGIDGAERQMAVLAVASIVNSGDHIWISPDINTPGVTGFDLFRFSLPEGFTELSVESNLPPGNIMTVPTGFAMTNPIPPGEYDVLMTYLVEYEGNTLDFPLNLPYGSDQVRMLIPEGNGTITGPGLGSPEATFIEDDSYSLVQGRDYAPGAEINVKFESLPTPNFVESVQNFFDGRIYILVAGWVVAAAMIGLLVYAFFFTRKRGEAGDGAGVADFPEYRNLKRAQIVETIAALDGQREAGEIEEDDYQARREALKRAALAARKTETQPT